MSPTFPHLDFRRVRRKENTYRGVGRAVEIRARALLSGVEEHAVIQVLADGEPREVVCCQDWVLYPQLSVIGQVRNRVASAR